MTIVRHLIRFVVAAIVLMVVGFIVPGFSVQGFWSALLAAVVIAALGWVVETFFGDDISPYARGIVGFLVSAVIIYIAQFIVPDMRVTVLGALLAALVIGVVDMFVPTRIRLGNAGGGDRENE
ncbi:MAG: hypothetical protein BAA01_07190 [Bacillus thermozeamaize]|uniref:Phage holin family protein n=1 Tax=Bacillus thermozeamaize TaxID=230954 RepID=A0A1Y3PXA6_9BACI|nr:MAG: hypothetical protein BAA01_07190 [Bacillus thermozeamaize]